MRADEIMGLDEATLAGLAERGGGVRLVGCLPEGWPKLYAVECEDVGGEVAVVSDGRERVPESPIDWGVEMPLGSIEDALESWSQMDWAPLPYCGPLGTGGD